MGLLFEVSHWWDQQPMGMHPLIEQQWYKALGGSVPEVATIRIGEIAGDLKFSKSREEVWGQWEYNWGPFPHVEPGAGWLCSSENPVQLKIFQVQPPSLDGPGHHTVMTVAVTPLRVHRNAQVVQQNVFLR